MMGMSLVGSLPVLSLNAGATLSLAGLQADIARINNLIQTFTDGTIARAELELIPPAITDIELGIAAQATAALELVGTLAVNADVSAAADITVELGLIDAALEAMLAIDAVVGAGLSAPGIAAWTYAGYAGAFGEKLSDSVKLDWNASFDQTVYALIVATEDPTAWESFKQLWDTGAAAYITTATDKSDLRFRGELLGQQLNLGAQIVGVADFIARLRGLKVAAEAQLNAALGIELPSLDASFLESLSIDASVILEGALDFSLEIAIPDASLELDLEAQISALTGDMVAWLWSGKKQALSDALSQLTSSGLPGGTGSGSAIYGAAFSAASPEAWAAFSAAGYAGAAAVI